MKTAVVTGANGFIGKAVTSELLKDGYFVYAIVTKAEDMADLACDRLKTIVCFFDDYPKLSSMIELVPDVFFHFAWQGVFGKAFLDYKTQMNNAVAAGAAVESAVRMKAKKFVLASTVNVFELKKFISSSVPMEFKFRPATIYASAKLSAEMICRTISSNSDISFNCAYIAMAYGPGNTSLMVPNVVIGKLLKGISPDLVDGKGNYDLIYIDDIAKGFVTIGEKGVPSKSYYLGHENQKTFREIFEEVGNIVSPEVKLNFGKYPDDNSIDYSSIDLTELTHDTGFSPSTDFRSSILKTADWIRNNPFLWSAIK
jgi:UDP-glucose 4-epimerase